MTFIYEKIFVQKQTRGAQKERRRQARPPTKMSKDIIRLSQTIKKTLLRERDNEDQTAACNSHYKRQYMRYNVSLFVEFLIVISDVYLT